MGKLVTLLAIAAVIYFTVVKSVVVEVQSVEDTSMLPTLAPGNYIVVNKVAYGMRWRMYKSDELAPRRVPARGDVVTYFDPLAGARRIGRVVALPNESVQAEKPYKLGEEECLVQGDNRDPAKGAQAARISLSRIEGRVEPGYLGFR